MQNLFFELSVLCVTAATGTMAYVRDVGDGLRGDGQEDGGGAARPFCRFQAGLRPVRAVVTVGSGIISGIRALGARQSVDSSRIRACGPAG
jgi:hypothetical protein